MLRLSEGVERRTNVPQSAPRFTTTQRAYMGTSTSRAGRYRRRGQVDACAASNATLGPAALSQPDAPRRAAGETLKPIPRTPCRPLFFSSWRVERLTFGLTGAKSRPWAATTPCDRARAPLAYTMFRPSPTGRYSLRPSLRLWKAPGPAQPVYCASELPGGSGRHIGARGFHHFSDKPYHEVLSASR